MNDAAMRLPEGAEDISSGGFNLFAGPFYRLADDGEARRFAFVALPKHMNAGGGVHGGLLMTFADIAMSRTSRLATGARSCSTVSLSCDFAGPGRLGELIEIRVRVTKTTRTPRLHVGADRLRRARGDDGDRAVEDRRVSGLEGYDELRLVDPFEIHVGPAFLERREGRPRRYAFRVAPHHCNLRGVVHGGMLMTLADMTLGQAVWGRDRQRALRHAQHADAVPEARRRRRS